MEERGGEDVYSCILVEQGRGTRAHLTSLATLVYSLFTGIKACDLKPFYADFDPIFPFQVNPRFFFSRALILNSYYLYSLHCQGLPGKIYLHF